MSITSIVENDTTKLPPGVHLPEGTEVSIVPNTPRQTAEAQPRTLAERYSEFIGICEDGPEDLAARNDHYASGAPKRKE
jgi:hypothetical protein